MNKGIKYKGEKLRCIKFLLGGIGTGNISLSGVGALTDWEIKYLIDLVKVKIYMEILLH